MKSKDELKQFNVNLPITQIEELDEYCRKYNIGKGKAVSKALEGLMFDELKTKAPDQAASIDDFEACLSKFLMLYRCSIEHSVNALDIARKDVKEQLRGMETIADSNRQLTEKLQAAVSENAYLKTQVNELSAELSNLKNESVEVAALTSENIELKKQLVNIQAEYNAKIKELQEDNFTKIVGLIKAANGSDK